MAVILLIFTMLSGCAVYTGYEPAYPYDHPYYTYPYDQPSHYLEICGKLYSSQ